MDTTSIQKAVNQVGGQTALSRLIGVSQALVWHWCAGRLKVRAERCAAIEEATHGMVTRYELRPDVFGAAPSGGRPEAALHAFN